MFALAKTSVFVLCFGFVFSIGPLVQSSKGEIWPKPYQQQKFDYYFSINFSKFSFNVSSEIACPNFLSNATSRYLSLFRLQFTLENDQYLVESVQENENYLGEFNILSIDTRCDDENITPTLGDVENYTLIISETEQILSAPTIWGVLRGLETFSQLIYASADEIFINATFIKDAPRFPYRGLHLDTARHFFPKNILFEMLDAMSYNKFNVFHWHLSDDQSFPYQSVKFPELSQKGAYRANSKIYKQSDIQEVIEWARLRGIRVIAEFDIPGHTLAWGASHPELLSRCYGTDGTPTGEYGPMNPSNNATYEFLELFHDEILEVFPDAYIHLGGDEVDFSCWKSDLNIANFMEENNIATYEELQSYFMNRVVSYITSKGAKPIVWEEAFLNGVQLENFSAIVQVWKWTGFLSLHDITKANKYAVFSSCWYLDYISIGGDWEKYYECEPLLFLETEVQKQNVLGGEACMWAEVVNEYNVMSRVWPRASAVAERLWSPQDTTDMENAKMRIEEHTCRMNARGIGAQPPNGPGACF